jgi:hypothetical protein
LDDPRLTKERLARARVIAKGRRIRDVERLVETYGGEASRWRKLATEPFMESPGRLIELHWYEHHGVGRFEIKEVWRRI